jgi:flagellin
MTALAPPQAHRADGCQDRHLATGEGSRRLIGANIETLTAYSNQLSTLNNNLSAANSQITDVDVAQESTNYAKYNILVQTGTAMLAQANALPQIG